MRTLYAFRGGIHPEDHKQESTGRPIAPLPLPARLVVPLQQHAGAAARPCVAPGARVLKGQPIGEPQGAVSAAVHAPTSGSVTEIGLAPVAHPSGLPAPAVTIAPDGAECWAERIPFDWRAGPPAAALEHLRQMGLAGLGGAVFPTAVKAQADGPLRTLIINGAECEPWITCDDLLMRSRASGVMAGIEALRALAGAREVLVGIEDNKPEAIAALQAVAPGGVEIVAIPTLYPAGGEKQLIQVLTGREVPSGGLPRDIGIACFNVATAYAVHRALDHGEPLIARVVTVTGAVRAPGNYEALLGTPLHDLITCAGLLPEANGLIMGGPLMGFELPSDAVPVVKATNCVIAKSPALFPAPAAPLPCIRCGRCAEACPAGLQPMDLYWFARSENFAAARDYALFDCIECGCCDYVCPSHIPLVGYYRYAKSELRAREKEQQAADTARRRHAFRLERLEREKRERAAKLAARSPGRAQAAAGDAPPAAEEE